MRTIICKKCGTPIDAELGECPVCGTVYYILPKDEEGDLTRVWDAETMSAASEIRASIKKDDLMDETKAMPQMKQNITPQGKNLAPKAATPVQAARRIQGSGQAQRQQGVKGPQPDRRQPNKNWAFIVVAVLLLAVLTVVITFMSGAFNFGGNDKMPQVVGINRDVAVNQLRALGISNPNIVYEDSSEPDGTVIEQNPVEGEPVNSSTAVTLTVSSGTTAVTPDPEEYIEVPDVVGDSFEVASARLEVAGLVPLKGSEEFNDTANEGTVTRQSPLSGAKLKQGDKVTLTVSKGKELGEYSIIITAGKGGKISPVGSVTIQEGENLSLVITPDDGYELSQLRIDGESVGAPSEYTVENIVAPHSVYAIFTLAQEPDNSPGMPTESPSETSAVPPIDSTPSDIQP